ncbi:MAG: hypothetical protein GY716_04795 [bacterium]|nr:hypothetical protein [bacterium]
MRFRNRGMSWIALIALTALMMSISGALAGDGEGGGTPLDPEGDKPDGNCDPGEPECDEDGVGDFGHGDQLSAECQYIPAPPGGYTTPQEEYGDCIEGSLVAGAPAGYTFTQDGTQTDVSHDTNDVESVCIETTDPEFFGAHLWLETDGRMALIREFGAPSTDATYTMHLEFSDTNASGIDGIVSESFDFGQGTRYTTATALNDQIAKVLDVAYSAEIRDNTGGPSYIAVTDSGSGNGIIDMKVWSDDPALTGDIHMSLEAEGTQTEPDCGVAPTN